MTIFSESFESKLGRTVNPSGADNVYSGEWQRTNPASTYYSGYKQLGTNASGSLNSFAGQSVYILTEAADADTAYLVEAAVDDVLIKDQ